ncbi:TPA: hypothetical protein N0F65_005059 [Lagenidium giganteum]|uniref:Uncharacterized protein n=1 Tax=Lagenidium giganteum TaxID=4803 RepID=A0AAV2ZLN1_9STRA|nr:TPA: hypothetical protein N0F65_005059 [Lagenidium giganteum]
MGVNRCVKRRRSLPALVVLTSLQLVVVAQAQATSLLFEPTQQRDLADSSLPTSSEVSSMLKQIGPVPCSDDAVVTINKVFHNNQLLVDACYNDTGYDIFPLSGTFPLQDQTSRVCASPACMDLLSGIVLAKIPECQYQKGSARSLAETFFRIRVDLANHRTSPKPEEFSQLYNLNMLVNEVSQNATLTTKMKSQISVTKIKGMMNPVEINPDIVLSDNYVVYVQTEGASGTEKPRGGLSSPAGSKAGTSKKTTGGTTNSTMTDSKDPTMPHNLAVVYLYIGLVWVTVNVSYFWLTHTKDSAEDVHNGNPGTVAPDASGAPAAAAVNPVSGPPAAAPAAPASVPGTTPAPTTYKYITSDMKAIMIEIGQINCTDEVRKSIFLIYQNNKEMFDKCVSEAKYQLFPYSGTLPTPEETTAICSSAACMDLLSGVVAARFPECDVDMFSIRTSAEVMFRAKKDIDNGRPAPTQVQFDELYNLNRIINLLSENASLIEDVFNRHPSRISLSEMTRMMNRIDTNPYVAILPNMTIIVNKPGEIVRPSQEPSKGQDSMSAATPVPSRTANATNKASKAAPRHTLVLAPLLALATAIIACAERDELLLMPCCYDGLTARLVERAGFELTFMSGFGVSAAHGFPDTQLLSFTEMERAAKDVCSALKRIPCFGDGDTGYGNAMNVKRTVAAYAQAGMAGIMLEDQLAPKRCGHTAGKAVVGREEAFARIRAAVDARREGGFDIVIIARTDARGTHSLEEAIARCQEFVRLGADMTFLEAPRSIDEMRAYCTQVPGAKLANMLEKGLTPILLPEQLHEVGYKVAAYPLTLLSASIKVMQEALQHLKNQSANGHDSADGADGEPKDANATPHQALNALLCDFSEVKDVVGFTDYYAEEARYKASS